MVLRTDVGREYDEHPGEQKETEIALSCGMEDGILSLYMCNIGDEGMAALGAAAEHLSNLREIHLQNNCLGDDSIQPLILIINQCPLKLLW
ncbi:hypothetical protein EMCRGX_G002782 [Ephydatia muelleri]